MSKWSVDIRTYESPEGASRMGPASMLSLMMGNQAFIVEAETERKAKNKVERHLKTTVPNGCWRALRALPAQTI